jgi:beta-glucosidase
MNNNISSSHPEFVGSDGAAARKSTVPAHEGEVPSPFPADFIWGASTSSYQIEGGAQADGRGASIWDTHCRRAGAIANGDTGDIACDHYHRYKQDIGLMQDLGIRAYRFSVAWPRVLPKGRGVVNESGLAFYDRLIDALLTAGVEPWLCLYHWDLPQVLDDFGGWTNRDSAGWFADYAALVSRRYGDRVKRFATFNEPSVFTLFGYAFGWSPPAVADPAAFHRALHHVNLAHGEAVDAIRSLVPGALIGCIHNQQPCLPASGTTGDAAAAARLDAYWNRPFADPQILGHYPAEIAVQVEPWQKPGDMARISRPVDWFGLNHYSPIYARTDTGAPLGFAWADPPKDVPRSGVGWHIAPKAFRDTLLDAHRRYRLPIYVLENGAGAVETLDGLGQVNDQERIAFLAGYTGAMRDAMIEGADVRGYFVWSLLDNFEWGAGYASRFGLVYVDYPTQRRIPKASAGWYAQLIAGKVAA